jgi:rod shape-determining protein MreC
MDWELYERYWASLILTGLLVISLLLLAFRNRRSVEHLRSVLYVLSSPTRFLAGAASVEPATSSNLSEEMSTDKSGRFQLLQSENARLHQLMDIKERRWPRSMAARVIERDPKRWFQEMVIDKGSDEGIGVDAPVIALVNGREGLVGRVSEVQPHQSKVMLISDSLSEVAAVSEGASGEDGVVEGSNSHNIYLKFLPRGSQVKIGDAIVTSGLGNLFPQGITIGTVVDLEPDERQLFLQAQLRPVVNPSQLGVVLVLI